MMASTRSASDLYGAEYDVPNAPEPAVRYAILSTPRVGSTLLSLSLCNIEGLGTPLEYLNPIFARPLARQWGVGGDVRTYLATMLRMRTSRQGYFGLKAHARQAIGNREMASALSVIDFDRFVFIRLSRQDKVAQAVSLARAQQTGRWSAAYDAKTGPARYDRALIDDALGDIEKQEAAWQTYLAALEHPRVLDITYEDLAGDYHATMSRVLMALDRKAPCNLEQPTQPHESAAKAEWAARYRSGD